MFIKKTIKLLLIAMICHNINGEFFNRESFQTENQTREEDQGLFVVLRNNNFDNRDYTKFVLIDSYVKNILIATSHDILKLIDNNYRRNYETKLTQVFSYLLSSLYTHVINQNENRQNSLNIQQPIFYQTQNENNYLAQQQNNMPYGNDENSILNDLFLNASENKKSTLGLEENTVLDNFFKNFKKEIDPSNCDLKKLLLKYKKDNNNEPISFKELLGDVDASAALFEMLHNKYSTNAPKQKRGYFLDFLDLFSKAFNSKDDEKKINEEINKINEALNKWLVD